jgi:hypothetical protein
MKLLGHLYMLSAFETANAANGPARPRSPCTDESLGPIASTPETAAAWRRWRDAGAKASGSGRQGLALPSPRPTL